MYVCKLDRMTDKLKGTVLKLGAQMTGKKLTLSPLVVTADHF